MKPRKGQLGDLEDRRGKRPMQGPPAPHKDTPFETAAKNFQNNVGRFLPKLPSSPKSLAGLPPNRGVTRGVRPAPLVGDLGRKAHPKAAKPGPGQKRRAS